MRGQGFTILSAFFIVTFPVLLINAILVWITVKYAEPGSFQALHTDVLVNIGAARFATISSWSSTLASIVSPFFIILASYPSSRRILQGLHQGASAHLPTPYQLAMMLEMRAGSTYGSLWRLLKYWSSYWGKRSPTAASLLVLIKTVLLGLVLSIFVFGTDTWLHLAIASENIFHYSPSPGTNLSFSLLPRCLINNNSFAAQSDFYSTRPVGANDPACTLNPAATNVFLVSSPINPIQVFNNLSSIAVVKRHTQDGRTYQYLAPSDSFENLRQDYAARTYGMSSECSPRSTICHLGDGMIGASTPFNCKKSGFSGAIQTSIQIHYFSHPTLFSSDSGISGFYNPFYFIGAVWLPSQWPAPTDDREIVTEVHGDRALIFNCSTTVYDITYSTANGSIVDFATIKSNISVSNALQSPIGFTLAAEYTLQQAFSFAGFSNSAQKMLDTWAPEFDRAAIAMGVTALQGSTATTSHFRDPAIVARIPLAPFACLLLANMLFAVSGAVLAMMAVRAGQDPETQEVAERMTAVGVIANYFEKPQQARGLVEKPEMMFEELTQGHGPKVAVERAEQGGYTFVRV
ncbi:hypothetical protein EDB80DRAFT_594756 [Ilyonectria destructans]|nr:hypothetical protein EDB80DRAFT_594756 [Ilyonectria destructans]